jgi:hypothetical protein
MLTQILMIVKGDRTLPALLRQMRKYFKKTQRKEGMCIEASIFATYLLDPSPQG